MSKKNNRGIKARYHKLTLEREREAALKRQQKAEKKQHKEAVQQLAGPSKTIAKNKRGGIRIRKGVTIKGIKVVDSASKRRVRELIEEEHADRQMDIDLPAEKAKKLPRKLKKKKPVSASPGTAVPME